MSLLSNADKKSMKFLAREDTLAIFYRGKYYAMKLGQDPTKKELDMLLHSIGLVDLKD